MKARRPVNPSRRISDSGTFPYSSSFFISRSRSRPYLSIAILILVSCSSFLSSHCLLWKVFCFFKCNLDKDDEILIFSNWFCYVTYDFVMDFNLLLFREHFLSLVILLMAEVWYFSQLVFGVLFLYILIDDNQ